MSVNVNPMSMWGFQRTTQLSQFKPVCSGFLYQVLSLSGCR